MTALNTIKQTITNPRCINYTCTDTFMHLVKNRFAGPAIFSQTSLLAEEQNAAGDVSWLQMGRQISMRLLSFHREPGSFKYLWMIIYFYQRHHFSWCALAKTNRARAKCGCLIPVPHPPFLGGLPPWVFLSSEGKHEPVSWPASLPKCWAEYELSPAAPNTPDSARCFWTALTTLDPGYGPRLVGREPTKAPETPQTRAGHRGQGKAGFGEPCFHRKCLKLAHHLDALGIQVAPDSELSGSSSEQVSASGHRKQQTVCCSWSEDR